VPSAVQRVPMDWARNLRAAIMAHATTRGSSELDQCHSYPIARQQRSNNLPQSPPAHQSANGSPPSLGRTVPTCRRRDFRTRDGFGAGKHRASSRGRQPGACCPTRCGLRPCARRLDNRSGEPIRAATSAGCHRGTRSRGQSRRRQGGMQPVHERRHANCDWPIPRN